MAFVLKAIYLANFAKYFIFLDRFLLTDHTYVRIRCIAIVYGYEVANVTKSVTMVRLDDSLKRIAKEQAEREGRSLSSLIALTVRVYLEDKQKSYPQVTPNESSGSRKS